MGILGKIKSLFEIEEDNAVCHTCHGNGKYSEVTTENSIDSVGMVNVEWKFCENCNGTGRIQNDGDVD